MIFHRVFEFLLRKSDDKKEWLYSPSVKNHFFEPQNIMLDEDSFNADGFGVIGSATCGDMMAVWIRVDEERLVISDCKWKTFGCPSAVASTSAMSVMVTENGGMSLKEAKRLTPEAIIERLEDLPDRKYHCSVLGHLALREAISNYEKLYASAK